MSSSALSVVPSLHFRLESTTLHYLMSCYAQSQCPGTAVAIVQHLDLLRQQPQLSDNQRHMYSEMLSMWETLAPKKRPRTGKHACRHQHSA